MCWWGILLVCYAVSCYSLFPLLYEAQEYPIKVLLLLLHSILMWLGFSAKFTKAAAGNTTVTANKKGAQSRLIESSSPAAEKGGFIISWVGKCYLLGLLLVEIWGQFLHPYLLGDKFPFVPLMLISIYCAFGIMCSWVWQLRWIISTTWFGISWVSLYINTSYSIFGNSISEFL